MDKRARLSVESFSRLKTDVERILFLGDILISFGDFLYNSKTLSSSGYVEEWWTGDLRNAIAIQFGGSLEKGAEAAKIPSDRLEQLMKEPFVYKPSVKEAITLSLRLRIPLHPRLTFFWSNLPSVQELQVLRKWVIASKLQRSDDLIFELASGFDGGVKQTMELLCLPHKVRDGRIVIEDDDAHALAFCLNHDATIAFDLSSYRTVLDALFSISGVRVKDKAPTFVGARWGDLKRRRDGK